MKSPLIFRIFKGEQIYVVKQFVDKDQILFGHEAEVDIDLESSEVSSIHCLIEKRGQQYFICDLGSTQGTLKNGESILDEEIHSGDEFTIGPFRVIFFIGVPKPVNVPKPTVVSAPVTEVVVTPTSVVGSKANETESTTQIAAAVEPPVQGASAPVATVTPIQTSSTPAQAVVTPISSSTATGSMQSKPQIHSAVVGSRAVQQKLTSQTGSRSRKGRKTFAPVSSITEIRDYIKPGKGKLVEVIVFWKERIINTYHFEPIGLKKMGQGEAIQLPDGSAPKGWTLLDFTSGVQVRTTSEMKVELHREGELKPLSDSNYRLQQNETVFISLINGMQLVIRFAPTAPIVPLESPIILSSSELTGILAAMIIAALLSLIVSLTAPKNLPKEEEIQRVAQVIFEKPPEIKKEVQPVPPPPPEPPKEKVEVKPPPKPPQQPKKIVESDKQKENKTKGDPKKPDVKPQVAQTAGRANEVKPKDSKHKTKMFTSTKQGGAIKTGEKAGANAQSKDPDPTNTGLLAAFGSGGARSKLDKAYSGSGELLGAGEKATGSSGFNENRGGDDLGSKFKDTGAGGKGTATQGIAGIGTKGRGTGMSEYGSGTGFGSKDQVAVQPGGAEEEFVGSIDREAVRRAVRSALSAFKACYDREYRKDTKLEGKVVIAWEIHEKGVARNARVVKDKSSIGNSTVEECVRARMLTLRFPEPPAGTVAEVTYPFLFQGQK